MFNFTFKIVVSMSKLLHIHM